MPKARAYKKSNGQRNSGRTQTITASQGATTLSSGTTGTVVTTKSRSHSQASSLATMQGLTMSIMVAFGCWGMAIFFAVFSTDPNRILFAGIACLMALMWSFSFFTRLRKGLQRK